MGSGIPLQATQWGIDVKESTRSNIYEANGSLVWDLYADYVSGSRTTLVCAIGSRKASETAQHALESSMAALGYGGALAFVTLTVDDIPLGDVDLFTLVEGIDPLAIVATDAAAAARLARAYRQNVPVDEASRIFCRNAVAFRDLESMLETPEGKQRAWALFKKLPRLEK